MKLYFLFFVFAVILSTCLVSAENIDEFKIRSSKVLDGIKVNFIIPPQGVNLEYRNVRSGSAEAQKNILGYSIVLDYQELENASDFELEGMFAHELGHIETYTNKNLFSMILYGAKYVLFPSFKREVERETDMKAIDRGFAIQLYEFRKYRLETASDGDRKILEKYYMSPEEIDMLIPAKGI